MNNVIVSKREVPAIGTAIRAQSRVGAPIGPVPAQKRILHKNLSSLGIGLPMKIATDDF